MSVDELHFASKDALNDPYFVIFSAGGINTVKITNAVLEAGGFSAAAFVRLKQERACSAIQSL